MTALLVAALLLSPPQAMPPEVAPLPAPRPIWPGVYPLAITCRGTMCESRQHLSAYCPAPWHGLALVARTGEGPYWIHCDGANSDGAHWRWDLMAVDGMYVSINVPENGHGLFYKLLVVAPDDYYLMNELGLRHDDWTLQDEMRWIRHNRRLFE